MDTHLPPTPHAGPAHADDTGMSDQDNITNLTTLRLQISAEAGAGVVILDGENPVADPAGRFVMPVTANGFSDGDGDASQGVHALSALATDTAGNRGQQSSNCC